jgi:transcription initiation factor TFIIE subunit alpha
MQINLLKTLASELTESNVDQIIELLFDKRDVNEFIIAKKLGMTINQIRNILYKLSAEGLVSFIRKKDKRKGWYIYYWTLDSKKCLQNLETGLEKRISELKRLLKEREQKRFYMCKSCNIEVSEEQALEHNFACEECAGVYELSQNDKDIKELNGKITRSERELKIIKEELGTIHEKEDQDRAKEQKRVAKEKEKDREKKKKERARLKKKEEKNNPKKKIEKKIKNKKRKK